MHRSALAEPEIRALEERAFNAWPALETLLVDGWVLRFAAGYTKRANSVNAWSPSTSVDVVIGQATPLYAAQGLPLIFRLSPLAPADVDRRLAALGFARIDETIVMTAPLGGVAVDNAATVAGRPEPEWLAGFAELNRVPAPRRAVHDSMLARVRLPAAFASLAENGTPAAYGLAIAERERVGLFDIVTAAHVRRRGLGRRLVQSLLAWGQSQGATQAYLQVVASNAPAIALYQRLGFGEAYRYHYRIAPETRD